MTAKPGRSPRRCTKDRPPIPVWPCCPIRPFSARQSRKQSQSGLNAETQRSAKKRDSLHCNSGSCSQAATNLQERDKPRNARNKRKANREEVCFPRIPRIPRLVLPAFDCGFALNTGCPNSARILGFRRHLRVFLALVPGNQPPREEVGEDRERSRAHDRT